MGSLGDVGEIANRELRPLGYLAEMRTHVNVFDGKTYQILDINSIVTDGAMDA